MKQFVKQYLGLCTLLFAFAMVMLPSSGHSGDMMCWRYWAEYNYSYGLGNIYDSTTDYLPLYHYILKFYNSLQGGYGYISSNLSHLKIITLIFHCISGFYLVLLTKQEGISWDKMLYKAMFYLFNVAILYNSLIWGQIDGILTCLSFVSIYYAYKKNILVSLLFYVLAINLKLQAIIFLPIVGLLWLPVVVSKFSVSNLVKWLTPAIFLQVLILLPFIMTDSLGKVWSVVIGSVGKYPSVSMNAFNIWYLLIDGDLMKLSDETIYAGLTYKRWGLLMFFILSAVILLPLAIKAYNSIFKKVEFNFDLERLLLICGAIPLIFFYFNTQMHERYSHPAYLFLIGYGIYTKRYFIAILSCVAYFLNLESVLKYMDLRGYGSILFQPIFISILHLITIISIYISFFRNGDKTLKNTINEY